MAAEGADGRDEPRPREARDVLALGQEVGRVLSDGHIGGRAEPFAKVFASSRVVKRAVGVMAWAVLEDIALDARIDDRGRLVAETTVRRIARNLGLNKDTVSKHLSRLREHGFVFQEESRELASGRWEPCRYVLDPSACVERFTVTPGQVPAEAATLRGPEPCPKPWDTVNQSVSENAGRGATGRGGSGRYERHVDEPHQQHVGDPQTTNGEGTPELRQRLESLGVAAHVAVDLIGRYPEERIRDAVDAADLRPTRNTAGWIVTALRDQWDLSGILAQRRADDARRHREAQEKAQAHAAVEAQQRHRQRSDGWCSAISDALDDEQLTRAVDRVTTPVPGLERRSVPTARGQLIAWAVEVHRREPGTPLGEALPASLRNGASPYLEQEAASELPEPPASSHPPDLSDRVAAHLRRGDDRVTPALAAAHTSHDQSEGMELWCTCATKRSWPTSSAA